MRPIGPRHLDTRRNLLPRDYFTNPWRFGDPDAELAMPTDGDPISQRIAWHTHVPVRAIREKSLASTTACTRYGFSRDVWSSVMTGRRWPGETVLTALLDTLHNPTNQP